MELEFEDYTFTNNVREMPFNKLKLLNEFYHYPKSPSRKLLLRNIRNIRAEYESRPKPTDDADETALVCPLCDYQLQPHYSITLKCKHSFCDMCILNHIRDNDYCPCCTKRCNYFDVLLGLKYKHASKPDTNEEVEADEEEVGDCDSDESQSVDEEPETIHSSVSAIAKNNDEIDRECEFTTLVWLLTIVFFMFYTKLNNPTHTVEML